MRQQQKAKSQLSLKIFEQKYCLWDGDPAQVDEELPYSGTSVRSLHYGADSTIRWARPHPDNLLSLTLPSYALLPPCRDRGFMEKMWGVNRYNLWGQVLGYFPRNLCMWPLLTAIVVGGMISDDRQHGTSAVYFSRPISRLDYTAMKYLSVAIILGFVIVFSYFAYYTSAIVFKAEGWAYLADTLPIFLGGMLAGIILVITYTSIGLALSSISRSRFFAAIGFLRNLRTKLVSTSRATISTTFMYTLSPYDCLAHLGQLLGIPPNYEHPVSISAVSILVMNSLAVWLLVSRVTSLEVTRK